MPDSSDHPSPQGPLYSVNSLFLLLTLPLCRSQPFSPLSPRIFLPGLIFHLVDALFFSKVSHFSRQTPVLFSFLFPSHFLINVLSVDLASPDNPMHLGGRPLDATPLLILSFPSPPLQLVWPVLHSGFYAPRLLYT